MAVETIKSGDFLSAQSSRALSKALNTLSSRQGTAASAVDETPHFVVSPPGASTLSLQVVVQDTVFASGESMTFEVKATKADGTVVTLASFVADDSNAGAVPVVLDGTSGVDNTKEIVAGDILTIERTYVAGGGATPATTTIVTAQVA